MIFAQKIPLGEGEYTEGDREKSIFLKEAGSFFNYYNSVIF